MSARSIALQGIGAGALAVALQGFFTLAVVIPPDVPEAEYSFGPILRAVETRKIRATVTVPPVVLKALLAAPEVRASASVGFLPQSEHIKSASPAVSGKVKVLLLPVQSDSVLGTITATGKHDLSDEELAAMILEIFG